jgi:hypothetical protein
MIEVRRAAEGLSSEQQVSTGSTLFAAGMQYAVVVGLVVQSFSDPKRTGLPEWYPLTSALATNGGMACELFMKAFLLSQGTSSNTLKAGRGHNLERLLEALNRADCLLSPPVDATVVKLGSLVYSSADDIDHERLSGLRYHEPGADILVTPVEINQAVLELRAKVKPYVLAAIAAVGSGRS